MMMMRRTMMPMASQMRIFISCETVRHCLARRGDGRFAHVPPHLFPDLVGGAPEVGTPVSQVSRLVLEGTQALITLL
jgi:hypothetical protein